VLASGAPQAGPTPDTAAPSVPDAIEALAPGPAAPSRADRVASAIEVTLCSGFPTQLLVLAGLAVAGVPMLAPDGGLSLAYVSFLSLIDTALLLGLIAFFLRLRGDRAAEVFLGARPVRRELLLGLLLVPVAFVTVAALSGAIARWAPELRSAAPNPLAALLRSPRDIAIFAFVVVVAGGIREELQRAFVLRRFEQHLGGAIAGLVIFSAVFGAGHAIQGWDAAVLTGTLGLLWGAVYLRRRSVVAPAVSHAAFNLIEVLYHGFGR
jgi:membrane protease YdiL (CAAX protease family)